MENAVIVKQDDSVVTVIEAVTKGGTVTYTGCKQPISARQDIPIYHKIAIKAVKKGDFIIRYGEKIGIATTDISPGDHVHVHNVSSVRA